jgi:uncharacterized membrane protein YhfC
MQVPAIKIFFMFISALVSIGVPVCLFLVFKKKFDIKTLPMVLGIAGFVVFAIALEGSIHRIVLGKFPLRLNAPVLYVIYGIFMAGIFEETARFIAFKILKRKYGGIATGLSYGIGHGGIESALLAGVSMLLAIVASIIINMGKTEIITARFQGEALTAINAQIEALLSTASYLFLVGGLERMMAMAIQLSLSIVVFYAAYGKNKLWLYPAAILLHAIIDIPAAMTQAGFLNNVMLVEGIVFLFAIAMAVFAVYLHKKLSATLFATQTATQAPGPSP